MPAVTPSVKDNSTALVLTMLSTFPYSCKIRSWPFFMSVASEIRRTLHHSAPRGELLIMKLGVTPLVRVTVQDAAL